MKGFLLACVVAIASQALAYHVPAPLDKHGVVVDTPEVAVAKVHHYAELSKAGGAVPHHHQSSYGAGHVEAVHHDEHRYHGPPAPLKHDGTVDETPEVKHVKAAHLAAVSEAFAKAPHYYAHQEYHQLHKRSPHHEYAPIYHAPAPLDKHGVVVDTPEVAAAKVHHYAELSKAGGAVPHHHHSYYPSVGHVEAAHHDEHRYHGPPAPLNHDGTVAETPEVKHVKAAHLAAVSEAFAKAPHHYAHQDYHHLHKRSAYHAYAPVYSGHYHGPPAPLNHDGTVAETPEVKHAKAVHFAAHAQAQQHEYSSYPLVHHGLHHFEPAPLNHDGTVAETPEVKHAKAVHFAAHAKLQHSHHSYPIVHHQTYSHQHHYIPAPLNHDGTVAETPEVHARRVEHLAAHHKALYNLI